MDFKNYSEVGGWIYVVYNQINDIELSMWNKSTLFAMMILKVPPNDGTQNLRQSFLKMETKN